MVRGAVDDVFLVVVVVVVVFAVGRGGGFVVFVVVVVVLVILFCVGERGPVVGVRDQRDDSAWRGDCAAVVVAGLPEAADVASDVAGEAVVCWIPPPPGRERLLGRCFGGLGEKDVGVWFGVGMHIIFLSDF